ncbi:hypothetical protein PI126_g12345 [Phytophthora idaei]|nr:hypothetical protein PI126_g12345 [Phytophthora idaei]
MTKIVMGLSQVLAKYDVVLVDQYGVLHNGTQPMIGAVDCFNRMIEAGKRVVLVSNTANRSSGLPAKLGAMGFSTDFQGVTGGDVCREYVKGRRSTHARCSVMAHDLGKLVSKTNVDSIFHGLDVEIVGLDKAQFLVVEGVQQFLRGGLERKLPLLCPNSDAVGVVENDRFVYMGSGIAKLYEEKGGEVVYFGKPTKEHFEVCLQLANVTDKSKVVHIGDSLHHDIQGATNVGVDSILIAGGVHAKQLEVDAWSDAEEDLHIKPELLDKLLGETELDPTYTATRFQW